MLSMTEISRPDVQLRAVERSGEPTFLFLHGLAGHRGEWQAVVDQLDPNVGVIAVDQRAHAASWDGSLVDTEWSDYVDDAASVIEARATGPVVVVGQSMGGVVAILLAQVRPDLVDHLVLIEAGVRPMEEPDFLALRAWFDRWSNGFADHQEAEDFFGPEARSTPAWVAGLVTTPQGLRPRFDVGLMLATMRSLCGTSRLPEWQQTSAPATLIRASESMISDDDVASMIEARPGTDVIRIEDSGHDVHLDQPGQVAQILTRIADELVRELSDGVVVLRSFRGSDAAGLLAGWDSEFLRFIGDATPAPSPTDVAVVDGVIVGWVDHDRDRPWLADGQVNVGYGTLPAYRGRGYATRALNLLVELLADEPDTASASLLINPANVGSIAVAERARFERQPDLEGQLFFTREIRRSD